MLQVVITLLLLKYIMSVLIDNGISLSLWVEKHEYPLTY